MSESGTHPDPTTVEPAGSEASAVVAQVVASVEALDDLPVAEHVAVFEHAHEQLRRALDPRHG